MVCSLASPSFGWFRQVSFQMQWDVQLLSWFVSEAIQLDKRVTRKRIEREKKKEGKRKVLWATDKTPAHLDA